MSSYLGSDDSDVFMRLHNLTPLVVDLIRSTIFDTVKCNIDMTISLSSSLLPIHTTSFLSSRNETLGLSVEHSSAHPKGGSPPISKHVSRCYNTEDEKVVNVVMMSTSTSSVKDSCEMYLPSKLLSMISSLSTPLNIIKSESDIKTKSRRYSQISKGLQSNTSNEEGKGTSHKNEDIVEDIDEKNHLHHAISSSFGVIETRWNLFLQAISWVHTLTEELPSYAPHVDVKSSPIELARFIDKKEWHLLQTSSPALYTHVLQQLVNYDERKGISSTASIISTVYDDNIEKRKDGIRIPELESGWNGLSSSSSLPNSIDLASLLINTMLYKQE